MYGVMLVGLPLGIKADNTALEGTRVSIEQKHQGSCWRAEGTSTAHTAFGRRLRLGLVVNDNTQASTRPTCL